jgi:hypothetical protein
MKNLLFGLLALGLLSCGSNGGDAHVANELASNDFEHLDGWLGSDASPSLTREKAHSGLYSVKVDPAIDYSMGYNNQLGRISDTRIRKIKLRGWVFLPSSRTPVSLVTEIKKPNEAKGIFYDSFDLAKAVRPNGYNHWVEIENTINVPETATYDSRILVYLWRGNSSLPAYLDDIQLIKEE